MNYLLNNNSEINILSYITIFFSEFRIFSDIQDDIMIDIKNALFYEYMSDVFVHIKNAEV